MWIQRTPEEIAEWHEATAREARFHGRLIAGAVGILVVASVAGGWIFSLKGGFVTHYKTPSSLLIRLGVLAVIGVPSVWFLYRSESRKELAKLNSRTICPACDTGGELTAGTECACGGTIVHVSTVKWVEENTL